MAKKLNLSNTEKVDGGVDVSSLINSVKKDIRKDFDISNIQEEVQDYLSTGVVSVNYAFSGKMDGGFPVGKLSELAGLNSTGKSLLAQHALVETQKKGGFAILVDSEFAFNAEWFEKLGGNPDRLIHFEPNHIEHAYNFIESTVLAIREKTKTAPITVVYDSVAASPSKYEYENDMEKFDMGKRAIAHGKGVRKITGLCKRHKVTFIAINQYRATMAMFGPEMDTVGGQGWKYHCGLRVDMKKAKVIKQKVDGFGEKIIGISGKLKVVKNRFRSPFAEANFDIYWENGIDPISGLFDVLTQEGVITPRLNDEGKVSKGWWTYKDDNFQESKFGEIIKKYPELTGGHTLIETPDNISIEEYSDGDDSTDGDADF